MNLTTLLLSGWLLLGSGALPAFLEHTIASGLKGGYQVVTADLNRDGKVDLIALASGMSDLVWFENPGWQRHTIAGNFTQMINVVVLSSGDHPVIVLASGFSSEAKNSTGIVSVLEPEGDVRHPWKVREIDRLPTSHRLRLADLDGNGNSVVVNAPLTAADTAGPDYRGRTPLVYYRPNEWKRLLLDDSIEGVMHGIHIIDWDGDGREEILSASFLGIHLHRLGVNDRWIATELAKGNPAPWPKSGASDVAVGRLGGRRFLCAIEPWHGNQVTLYREDQGQWLRQVLDDSFIEGHAIYTADLNEDGFDEIIAGFRGKGGSVYIYTAEDKEGVRWKRHSLDQGGISAASCAVADLNGDGKPDIACIGSSTANLKWYENKGTEKRE
jgi:hypothetical protein